MDLTNNALVVPYASLGTLLNDTRQMLLDGRLNTSLSVGGYALGYADNAALGKTFFGGQSVNGSTLLIGYTVLGDSNLDGNVNALDFNAVAAGYGSGTTWQRGDFNYDGLVNSEDFNLLSVNFSRSLPASSPADIATLVPEPTIMIAMTGIALLARRRAANLKS
jgi:hypothetical protein